MSWIRLYDPDRVPAHWTEIVRRDQYVVFVCDAMSRAPRDAEGRPFCDAGGRETGQSAALCDTAEEAETLAWNVVARHPELCCEIYDSEGKAKPPAQVIYDPSVRDKHVGVAHARRQALAGGGLMCAGVTLVAIDASRDLAWIWGYVIGLKCLLLGGVFLSRGVIEWLAHRHEGRFAVDSRPLQRID